MSTSQPAPDRRTAEHSALSASERSTRASLAANARWSKADGTAGTHAARTAFMDRFYREVDPDGVLAPDERERRAERAKSAHFQRMALARARKRRANAPAIPA